MTEKRRRDRHDEDDPPPPVAPNPSDPDPSDPIDPIIPTVDPDDYPLGDLSIHPDYIRKKRRWADIEKSPPSTQD